MGYEERIILEAIDQLRLRKARPDFQRICNFLMRNFAVKSPSEVKAALDKCIVKEIVLKVEYKGNISYRNATRNRKSKHANIPFNDTSNSTDSPTVLSTGLPSKKFKGLLANAFTELVVQEPDYLYDGVPGSELILKILSKDTVRSYTKRYLSILIEKLAANGVLYKVGVNGNYLLGPNLHEEAGVDKLIGNKGITRNAKSEGGKCLIKKSKMEDGVKSNNKSSNIRVGSRRKRAKKVFDPSDNNLPKKRGRPPLLIKSHEKIFCKPKATSDSESKLETGISSNGNKEQGGVCSVCHNNKKSANDPLVHCQECSNKAHYNCINGDDMMLKLNPDSTWQCPHCKACVVCGETSDAGDLMVCSLCADCYHTSCLDSHASNKCKTEMKWFCNNCQMSEQLQVIEIHPNVQKDDVIKLELSEEIDVKEESSSAMPSFSSSDEDSKDSSPCSQTPPTLSPQPPTFSAVPSERSINYNRFQNNDFDTEYLDKIDPTIPDASEWTSEDVYNYFVQYFPKEAEVFKEQEIDGRSLLLMKRWDVLTSLNLKLGPALKVYRHVVKLQFRRDDPKLYWL